MAIGALINARDDVMMIVEELAALTDWSVIRVDTSMWVKKRVQAIIYRDLDRFVKADDTIPSWANLSFREDGASVANVVPFAPPQPPT